MKRSIISLSIILMLLFTACGDNNENETSANETVSIADTKDEKIDLTDYNMDFVADTDFQSYFACSEMAESENGYYYWGTYNQKRYLCS